MLDAEVAFHSDGFAGVQLDPESGFYYNRARMYAPGIGRFLSRDPIGFRGGDANLYRYVNNNPLRFFDPTGRCRWLEGAAATFIASALADAMANFPEWLSFYYQYIQPALNPDSTDQYPYPPFLPNSSPADPLAPYLDAPDSTGSDYSDDSYSRGNYTGSDPSESDYSGGDYSGGDSGGGEYA